MNISEACDRINSLIGRHILHFEENFGYSPGENGIKLSAGRGGIDILVAEFGGLTPPAVIKFFGVVAEVSLPDFWNGYFIGPPSWIASLHSEHEPFSIQLDSGVVEVLVFGSDGGGGLYALPIPDGQPVYMLPPGEIVEGRYAHALGSTSGPTVVAKDFVNFIEILVHGLEGYLAGEMPAPFG